MKKLVLVIAAAFVLAGLAAPVQATPITGSSSGVFSSYTCTSNCAGATTSEIWWGDFNQGNNALYSSYMIIVPVNYVNTGYGTPFEIADLHWRNSVDADGTWSPNPFSTLVTLTFSFTAPSVANQIQTLNLSIYETLDNPADQTTLPSLAGISLNLGGGYTIDTFTYSVTGAGSLLNGLTWIGDESTGGSLSDYKESDLQINAVAHFSGGGTTVPEPGSMLLLGTGLIVAGAIRRRMQK